MDGLIQGLCYSLMTSCDMKTPVCYKPVFLINRIVDTRINNSCHIKKEALMNFGMDYYNLLTGGISSTNRLLEQYSAGKLRRANSGNGVQKSNRAFNSINTGSTYGSLYKLGIQNNSKMLDGAMKADNAGRQLSNNNIYREKNRDYLNDNAKNLVNGYNDIVEGAMSNSDYNLRYRATVMKGIAAGHSNELEEIGIKYIPGSGKLTVDEDKLESADITSMQKVFATNGSFGQNVRASAAVTQKAASAQIMNQSRLAALTTGYGMNGLYNSFGGLGGFGLTSFFGNWFV